MSEIVIFCSYASNDEKWLRQLETHLNGLKRQGFLSFWHNQEILAGSNWAETNNAYLEASSIILCLVSADFLASDYCYGVEMARALERHRKGEAQMILILVRPVDWRHAPFARLRPLPLNAKPLSLW